MNWIDLKYIGVISPKLPLFTRKDDNVWNLRCPLCGDSKKSKTKARGFILNKGKGYFYTCHNCNVSLPFAKFLETIDKVTYDDYIREKFLDKIQNNTERIVEPVADISKFITPKFIKYTELSKLKKISQLEINHPARKYVVNRKIPNPYHAKLFYAPKFKAWTNTLKPDKFDLSKPDEPRLVIPFLDQNKNLFGFQGRAFSPIEPRYITIILDDTKPKIYGLENLNVREKIFVVEGPIDSMFLPNALAMAGSHLDQTLQNIGVKPSQVTVIYDNEPRNVNIVKAIEKAINNGYNVCIWPSFVGEKDINDMIKKGKSSGEIVDIIQKNTFNDLTAKLMLQQWKKI
jgi:transcription elongation factor Elf1